MGLEKIKLICISAAQQRDSLAKKFKIKKKQTQFLEWPFSWMFDKATNSYRNNEIPSITAVVRDEVKFKGIEND